MESGSAIGCAVAVRFEWAITVSYRPHGGGDYPSGRPPPSQNSAITCSSASTRFLPKFPIFGKIEKIVSFHQGNSKGKVLEMSDTRNPCTLPQSICPIYERKENINLTIDNFDILQPSKYVLDLVTLRVIVNVCWVINIALTYCNWVSLVMFMTVHHLWWAPIYWNSGLCWYFLSYIGK